MCLLFIPTILLIVVGIYYVSVKGVVKLLIRIQELGNEYRKKRLQTLADKEDLKRRMELAPKSIDEAKKQKEAEIPRWYERLYVFSTHHYIASALIASIIAAVLFSVIVLVFDCIHPECCYMRQYVTDNERVVLAFVGILATFVVVTNYAQVAELSRRVEKQLKANNKRIDYLETQIQTAQNTITDKTSALARDAFMRSLSFVNACQDKQTLDCARAIVAKYLQNNEVTFSIGYNDTHETKDELILVKRETKIYFRNTDDSRSISITSKDIKSIDDMSFNSKYINDLVFNLLLINNITNS